MTPDIPLAVSLIRKVLDDEESRPGGWGPDVTCVAYLEAAHEALTGEKYEHDRATLDRSGRP